MAPSPGTLLAAGNDVSKTAYEIRSTKQNHGEGHIHQKRSDHVAGEVRRDHAGADGVGPDHRISSGTRSQGRRFSPAYHQSDSRLARQRVRAFGRQPGASRFLDMPT